MLLNDWTGRANTIPVKNTTTETIPPGAVMIVTGSPDKEGRLPVGKPTLDNQFGVIINGPHPILGTNSKDGTPYGWGTYDSLVPVAYQKGDSLPTVLSEWGPQKDKWDLKFGNSGFVFQASANDTDHLGVFFRAGSGFCYVRRKAVARVWCEDGKIAYSTRQYLAPVSRIVTVAVVKPAEGEGTIPADNVTITVTAPDYGDDPIAVTTDDEGSAIVKLPEGDYTFTITEPEGFQAVDPPGSKQTLAIGAVAGCDKITYTTLNFELEVVP